MNKVTTATRRASKMWDYSYAFLFAVFVTVGVVLAGAILFHVQAQSGSKWILYAIAFCAGIVTRRAILLHRGRRNRL